MSGRNTHLKRKGKKVRLTFKSEKVFLQKPSLIRNEIWLGYS